MKRTLHKIYLAAVLITCILTAGISSASAAGDIDESVPVNPLRNVYFGDVHLHTSNSYDAAWAGTRTTRKDAYRYAQGYPVNYFGHMVKRKAPLDFLAVSDHAEYLGVTIQILQDKEPFAGTGWKEQLTEGDRPGFSKIMGSAFRGPEVFEELNTDKIKHGNWQSVIDDANEFNQPGKFTTFVAFEWSTTPGGSHLHRVAIFPGPKYPDVPFSALDSRHPEDLWRYIDNYRNKGVDSLLIPHNPNLSNGMQFSYNDSYGKPISRKYAQTKSRNEPLVEVTQIKGTSETRPELSPTDEFAGFEILNHWVGDKPGDIHGSYAREAYARGMEIAERVGVNPYEFGLIGSSDYHSSTSATEEDNDTGALGNGDLPFGENIKKILTTVNPIIRAPIAALSASGITGVWAVQNTREAIFAAMKRREVYATSGPRIQVRMFAGWDYPGGLIRQSNWLEQAYANGVPMGGNLQTPKDKNKRPHFLVFALKDPDGANLDRIQIIKVWRAKGESHEKVFDVVWSGDRGIDPKTGKVPAVGNTVDLTTATYTNDIGSVQLNGEWTDPEFQAGSAAVYYARVIEIPTPRWPTYLAVRNHLPIPDTVPPTHQERAWTSPIFYHPK